MGLPHTDCHKKKRPGLSFLSPQCSVLSYTPWHFFQTPSELGQVPSTSSRSASLDPAHAPHPLTWKHTPGWQKTHTDRCLPQKSQYIAHMAFHLPISLASARPCGYVMGDNFFSFSFSIVSLSSRRSSLVPTRMMGVLGQWCRTSGNH